MDKLDNSEHLEEEHDLDLRLDQCIPNYKRTPQENYCPQAPDCIPDSFYN